MLKFKAYSVMEVTYRAFARDSISTGTILFYTHLCFWYSYDQGKLGFAFAAVTGSKGGETGHFTPEFARLQHLAFCPSSRKDSAVWGGPYQLYLLKLTPKSTMFLLHSAHVIRP